jgi:hypothetical protein
LTNAINFGGSKSAFGTNPDLTDWWLQDDSLPALAGSCYPRIPLLEEEEYEVGRTSFLVFSVTSKSNLDDINT